MSRYFAALDLGGTHVRAAVVADDGTIRARVRERTPTTAERPDFLVDLVERVRSESASVDLDGAVVGIPGIIDHVEGRLVKAPNIPDLWDPWITEDWLGAQLRLPVGLANDADLAAVGEARFGAGRGRHDVVYVTISTGVGAGILAGGKLVRARRSGGEIGHTVIDVGAARAGRPATVEELGAGPAIAKAAAEAGLVERDAALADLVRAGDPTATKLWNRAIGAVGAGVANLAWLIGPEVVVIGGGVGNNSDIVLPVIAATLADLGPANAEQIDVVGAALGDDAALTGAAAWFDAIGRPLDHGVDR